MRAEHRIQGLFSGGEPARDRDDGSGLRVRPQPIRPDGESLPDLSDQAVELPDEDDCLDGLTASDTFPPSRAFRAALVEERLRAVRTSPPRTEPPPLPVALGRPKPPPLPLPLTRRTVPPDEGRISFGEVARTAVPAAVAGAGAADDVVALRRRLAARERRRRVGRAALGAVVLAACFALGFGAVELMHSDAGDASMDTAAAPVATHGPASAPAPVRGLVELGEVVVQSGHAAVTTERPQRASHVARLPHVAPEPVPAQSPEPPRTQSPEPPRTQAAEPPRTQAVEPPQPELPAAPSRADVLAAVGAVQDDVRACVQGTDHHGVVPVRISVAPSGRVTTAVVQGGGLVGTAAGSCVARAVRGARFPAFSQPRFSVDYPFSL